MMCPACRMVGVNEIQLELGGSEVTLHACVRCEHRWWDRDGEQVALDEVLHLISPPVAILA